MTEPRGDRRKAIHEAGHAVVARRRGIRVKVARIGTPRDPQGYTQLDLPKGQLTAADDRDLLDALAETHLAAREAETLILGTVGPDFTFADDDECVDAIADEFGLVGAARAQWRLARRAAARKEVADSRDAIERAADQLLQARSLDGEDLDHAMCGD